MDSTSMIQAGWKSLLLPGICVLVALAVLISLGNWQMQRRAWKESVLAKIDARTASKPISLAGLEDIWKSSGDVDYQPVRVTGRFRHDLESHYFASGKLGVGWHIYTPLEISGGRVVFVNRGFVPDTLKDAGARASGQVSGDVAITGLARNAPKAKANDHIPDNDPSANIFYWRGLPEMASRTDIGGADILPFFIDADAAENPGGWPKGGVTRISLSNRHLEYALTWYGFAVTLIGVFAAFAWVRLNRRDAPE